MAYQEVVKKVIRLLVKAKIPYAIVGGLAAGYYGTARSTRDVDVIVTVDRKSAEQLVKFAKTAGFVAVKPEVLTLVRVSNRFVMESSDGYRIDFWLAKTNYDKVALKRRRRGRIYGRYAWIVAPEDLILQKLRAGRPRDVADVIGVLIRQRGKLDMEHLQHWAAMLDILGALRKLMRKTGVGG